MKFVRPDPYIGSNLVRRAESTRVVNFFDIDGTLAMGGTPSQQELRARETTRLLASQRGAMVFISARTPELIMDSGEYNRSVYRGFLRPPPRAGKDVVFGDYRVEVPLEQESSFRYVTGSDAIASMGVGVFLSQDGGYVADYDYEADAIILLRGRDWRHQVSTVLRKADKEGDIFSVLAPIEFHTNYLRGKIDVAPLEYRFQLDWEGDGAAEQKRSIKDRLETWFAARPDLSVRFVDESNPAKGRYTLYLIHSAFRKEKMLERLLARILAEARMQPHELTVNIFGDTLTDLRQIYAGGVRFGQRFDGSAVRMNFVLVGSSRLSDPIRRAVPEFGGEDLTWLYRLLERTDECGVYDVNIPNASVGTRRFILADELFPDRIGPESIQDFFEQEYDRISA